MSIKSILKKNGWIRGIYRKLYNFYTEKYKRSCVYWLGYKNPTFWLGYFMRSIGLGKSDFKKLKQLKDTENGRCFIVATGPSLTIEDLSKLKNERTIGLNSLCKIFPQLGWETTYYAIQDYGVFLKLKENMEQLKDTILFHADQKFKKKRYEKH